MEATKDDQAEVMADLEEVYDTKISPLMERIIAICEEHKMPMLCSFYYADDSLCTTSLLSYPTSPDSLRNALGVIKPAVRGLLITVGPVQ